MEGPVHYGIRARCRDRDTLAEACPVRRKGQELFDKMRDAYTLRDASRRSRAELFPPVYARVEHRAGPCLRLRR
jgi:hypothetical protein